MKSQAAIRPRVFVGCMKCTVQPIEHPQRHQPPETSITRAQPHQPRDSTVAVQPRTERKQSKMPTARATPKRQPWPEQGKRPSQAQNRLKQATSRSHHQSSAHANVRQAGRTCPLLTCQAVQNPNNRTSTGSDRTLTTGRRRFLRDRSGVGDKQALASKLGPAGSIVHEPRRQVTPSSTSCTQSR